MKQRTVSCLLFYGPGAYLAAQNAALNHGPYAGGPFGEGGLKIDEAREIALLAIRPAVGDLGRQSMVVGPMDAVREGSADALLKSIEEIPEYNVRPFLWAEDIGEVRPTIVSRCIPIWCHADEVESEFSELGGRAFSAYQSGNLPVIIECVEEAKGNERAFLLEVVRRVSPWVSTQPKTALELWGRIRQTLESDPVSQAQAVDTLWPPQLS